MNKVNNVNNTKLKRIPWLDVARLFAIISISLNHAVNRSYPCEESHFLFFQKEWILSSLFAATFQILSRIGVPVFLMISGSLLLKKDIKDSDDIKKFYKRNLLPMFITTEIWLFIMFWYMSAVDLLHISGIGSILHLLKKMVMTMCFVNQKTFGSIWYMNMILCVYLLIPFLAILIKKIEPKYFMIPFFLVLLSAFIVPNFNNFLMQCGINKKLVFELSANNLFSKYMLWIIAGYYISIGKFEKIRNDILIFITSLSFVGCCLYQLWSFKKETDYIIDYNSFGIFLVSIGLFEIFRRFCNKEFKCMNIISYISKISFAIYFIHICIMGFISTILRYFEGRGIITINRPLKLVVLELASFLGSIILIKIFSKSKWCSKYLFMIKG